MPHFWCGVMKFRTISLLAVARLAQHRRRRCGYRSAAVGAKRLAEIPHPAVILVELLAARQSVRQGINS